MKRVLLILGVMLSITSVSAQTIILEGQEPVANKIKNASMSEALPSTAKKSTIQKAPRKVTLASNERIMGFIDGDDYDDSYMYGYPSYGAGERKAGVIYDQDIVDPFVGGLITRVRFALAYTIGSTVVRVYHVYNEYNEEEDTTKMVIGDEVATDTLSTTAVGWNEVTLSTPVTIGADTTFLISYDYYQYSSTSSYSSYPLACDGTSNATYGMLIYNCFETYKPLYAGEWVSWRTSESGSLAIQAVVQKDDYEQYDLSMTSISSDKYIFLDEDLDYSFGMKPVSGTSVPESYAVTLAIDGEVVDTLTDPISLLTTQETTYESTIATEGLEGGSHTLTVYFNAINGAQSTTTDNDTLSTSFTILSTTGVTRGKQLIEHYTSQYCTYCPYGYNILNALVGMRDDIAWVSIHSAAYSSYIDAYTVSDAKYIEAFSTSYYPAASFNRYYDEELSEGYLAPSIGYSDTYTTAAAEMFSDLIDDSNQLPSLTSLDITSTLAEDGVSLSITVSGTATTEFATYMGDDAVLTVYLTEDSLIGTQLNLGVYNYSYEHNNVLRAIVSEPLGDAINWNGLEYENTYTTTLDASWVTANMNIVAFISRPIIYSNSTYSTELDDAIVNQCNKAAIGEAVTGISTVRNDASSSEVVGRYAIDGRPVSADTQGLQIIRYANGTTKKVITCP